MNKTFKAYLFLYLYVIILSLHILVNFLTIG